MDLSKLNDNQLKAVQTTEGPVLVIAGAGTGKTSVLTNRIAYLIQECGAIPDRILAFTFTNKAAEEMKSRIASMIEYTQLHWVRTYHSTCLMILKEDIDKLGWRNDFSIIDDDDQVTLVKTIIKDLKINTKVQAKKFVRCIGAIKLNDIDFDQFGYYEIARMMEFPTELDARALETIYKTYVQRLKAGNQLDFEDLINFTHKLFKDHEEIRNKWKARFDYILVDEYQDTNIKQFEILKWLVDETKNNVFAVGDPNQTIYTWRGAYPEVFDEFVDHFKCKQIINLNENYRSTFNILKSANSLINHNPTNFKNDLIAVNTIQSDVKVYVANYPDDEANYVCSLINLYHKSGKEYSDILVLYRANYCSRLIEEKLINNQIPYVIFGTVNFYQRKEIKDIISYLKAIYSPDDISLMRIINVPRRAIGVETINAISMWAANRNITFVQAINEIESVNTISDAAKNKIKKFIELLSHLRTRITEEGWTKAIKIVLEETHYIEWLQANETEVEDRLENIESLQQSLGEFFLENPNSVIVDFLNKINLYTSAEKTKLTDSKPCVHLMTVHMAKGKEYDSVIIFNFNEGVIPSSQALLDEKGIEEERRIAYVAMTRAKNNLVITCTKDNNWGNRYRTCQPSRFLKEIKHYKDATRIYTSISDKDIDWYDSKKHNDPFKPDIDTSKLYTNTYVYKVGDVVVHTVFGSGVVTAVNGDIIDVVFKKPYGTKTLNGKHNSIKRVAS